MNNKKFNVGDLVRSSLRGYGVVLETGHKKENHEHDIVGVCEYAIIQWQNNLHSNQSRVSYGSIGWKQTEVLARGKENEQ